MSEKIKICVICKKEIKPKDNYCRLTDYKQGEFFMENYYHTLCYNNQIRGVNPEQKKVALALLREVKKLINRAKGEPEEVYEIK